MSAGLRAGARLARATVDPQAAAEIAQGVGSGMRGYARELLGITDLEERIDALTPAGDRFAGPRGRELIRGEQVSPEVQLRAQGAELLRQSADVSVDDRLHPAFGRILGELAPDEGRILRLLAQEGSQPVVDVRAANLIGVGSQLVAQNLNMVDMQAGCRHPDRVPAYLGNLQRLGLASFSDAPLDDAIAYQVLEAQPHVLKSIQATSRAKTVHRSLCLTPFGTEFCEACFAPEPGPEEELPEGVAPESDGDQ
jgi:abortive infection alpha-like protein